MLKVSSVFSLCLIISLLGFIGGRVYATNGCLVGTALYTQTNGTGSGVTYYDYSPMINAAGYCLRKGTTTTPCRLRVWFFVWINGDVGIQGDFGANNPPAYCPIDDYIPFLVLITGGLALFYLRRKDKATPVIR